MKTSRWHLTLFVLATALLALSAAEPPGPTKKVDPFKPLRVLVGKWEGDVQGEPGSGKAEREYVFVLNDHFIQVRNSSTYPPQEKNPKGEMHHDLGFISYDKATRKLTLRQFHVEGFVNQFALESISEDNRTIVFTTTSIENIPPGWKAKETYRIISDDEFTETFALAKPNRAFATYSETHFRRKK